MNLNQKIAAARNKKGLTQEELAELTKVTVRTIQRIESGDSTPRMFTLKAIAVALDTSFEELNASVTAPDHPAGSAGDTVHFLNLLCLSCFSYLVVPVIHFLFPIYLLKKRNEQNPGALALGRQIIRGQIWWVITTHLLMLLTLAYNFLQAVYWGNRYFIHYLYPFFMMYLLNAVIIVLHLIRIRNGRISV